jgi:hypothetical protein
MKIKAVTLATLLALTPALGIAQSVYKWTDENGVTHFGDRQPAGKQSERVSIKTGRPSGDSRQSPRERLDEMEEQQRQARQRADESAAERARRKQREAACETARSNLKIIERNSRIRVEENGEQRFLSPEEISQKKQEFRTMVDENCGPAGSDQK